MIKHVEKGSHATAEDLELSKYADLLERRLAHQAEQVDIERAEMDSLAHSISHDLRSPLHIVTGFADLLSRSNGHVLDEKGRHYLERITIATGQLAQMMDEVLTLSRVGRIRMSLGPVDLGPIVNRLVHDLDMTKGDRRISWQVGRMPRVLADATLIREVMASLLSNALKFADPREVARVQVGATSSEGESTIFVRDHGTNANVRQRERGFGESPGQRPSSAQNMGPVRLAYVQRIIRRHGGRLWAESVAGDGVTFYFTIPKDPPEAANPREPR